MAINNNLDDFLTDIADAIRSKKQNTVATTPSEWRERLLDEGIDVPLSILQDLSNSAESYFTYYLVYCVFNNSTKITFMLCPDYYVNTLYRKHSNGYYYPMDQEGNQNLYHAFPADGSCGRVYDISSSGVVSGVSGVKYSPNYLTQTVQKVGNTYSGPYTKKINPTDFATEILSI